MIYLKDIAKKIQPINIFSVLFLVLFDIHLDNIQTAKLWKLWLSTVCTSPGLGYSFTSTPPGPNTSLPSVVQDKEILNQEGKYLIHFIKNTFLLCF